MTQFEAEKYLKSPSYSAMTGRFTGEQVKAIADARIKEQARIKALELASEQKWWEELATRQISLPIEGLSRISPINQADIKISPVDIPSLFPKIELIAWANQLEGEKSNWVFPDTSTILSMKPAELEKVFWKIIEKIKSGWKFTFANIDDTTFRALQAVYVNWRIPTHSLAGSEFIHWLANSIIVSGEAWDNKRLVTNNPEHQKLFSEVVLKATSPAELKSLLIAWNSEWGRLAPWRTAWGEKQWWGVGTWVDVGRNMEWKTQDFLNALRTADPAYGRLYSIIWTYTADKDIWSQLKDSLLYSPWFKGVRDAIIWDILGRAAVKKGIFFKTESHPEIAGKNPNDIDITNIFSSRNIPNWIEFNIEGKPYVIGSSLRDGIVILAKEAASKTYEPVRLSQG